MLASSMYVTRIELEDLRGFLGGDARTDLPLPEDGSGWHVFAGRNGSGKSTLLRSLAIGMIGPDHSRHLVPSFNPWIRADAGEALLRVHLGHGDGDIFKGIGKLPSRPFVAELRLRKADDGGEPLLEFSPARQKKLLGAWRGPWGENPRGWLVSGYGPFRRLTGHASDAQRVMVGPNHQRRLVSLFREDASLVEAVGWLQEQQFRKLEKREGANQLLNDVIELLNNGLLPDGASVSRVDSEGLWVRRAGMDVELRELSDGYRVALALVLDIIRHMHDAYGEVRMAGGKDRVVDMPGVVLIDEIDAHLHVSWQQRIGFWLSERFPKVQFLVTTHSPFVCQAAKPGGLFRLPSPGEPVGVQPVDDSTFKRVVNGTVNDAVLSHLFGLERSRSPRAQKLTEEWSRLRAKDSRSRLTSPERARFEDLTAQLPLPFDSTTSTQ
ncbi:MAG: ATP-binding protein [Labilithrix sp.]|nr:ATP-binding protein [Labilithrix sp.]